MGDFTIFFHKLVLYMYMYLLKRVFKTDNHLMQVKSIAECILSTCIKLQPVFRAFVCLLLFFLLFFGWPLKTGFTV